MFESGNLQTATGAESEAQGLLEFAQAELKAGGISAAPAVLAVLRERGVDLEDPMLHSAITGVIAALLEAFDSDLCSPQAYAALAQIPADHASVMFDLTLDAIFGNHPPHTDLLSPKAILCLVGALSAAGEHERAAVLLKDVNGAKQHPAVRYAAWVARCRWAGCTEAVSAYWQDDFAPFATLADADAALERSQADIDAWRSRIRFLLESAKGAEALDALCIALSLPLGESDKRGLAAELALLAPVLLVRGDKPLLDRQRTRWALGSCPQVVTDAVARIQSRVAAGAYPFLDEQEALAVETLLVSTIRAVPGVSARGETGYPMRNGKPHVDIVWLEITNHCNQKCTFCPDMFREDARTWLPLEQVKQVIDQLVEGCSVGSMQLNAYGEPLLHPNIDEILAYIRERNLPFPTFFTSHGMTLVEKKLRQLSGNYPSGIAISLHNDSQQSYELTRSSKIGDYDTLVSRVTDLMRQMVNERAACHVRLYQMVSNGAEDKRVDEQTRAAFPETAERMLAHVRKWEAIASAIADAAPLETGATAHVNSAAYVRQAFSEASHGDKNHLPILSWRDHTGVTQHVFMSARPVGTYANLLLEYDPRWNVERKLVSKAQCGFTNAPSLAVYATGKLGICCLDLNSTATFGSLSDYDSIADALKSPEALRIFAQLSNGVAASRGCQICLGGTERLCGDQPRPTRPAGHFREGI